MKTLSITEEEVERYHLLQEVTKQHLTLAQAALLMGVSYRHALRLKQRFLQQGLEGLCRRLPPQPPRQKITPQMKQTIIQLRQSLYHHFNLLHFHEKLAQQHHIHLSYESLRQLLIQAGLHQPRQKQKVYRRRRRMPCAGMLVQMDSSQHRWLPAVPQAWWLVAMIDDADSYVYAEFHPKESTLANMSCLYHYIQRRGVFRALYVDRASHFKTTRHGGIHYEVNPEQADTQIQRALGELGIEILYAHTPQAKGRVERLFRFFQDRLIKEMQLAGITDYDQANRFLQEQFLPWYNQTYTRSVPDSSRPLPAGLDLSLVLSVQQARKVGKDNTVRFEGQVYQLLPSTGCTSWAGKWVQVAQLLDGREAILYEGKPVHYVLLSEPPRRREQAEALLSQRQYVQEKAGKGWKPPADHPWRRSWKAMNSK
ncbi:MAG: ISNCY family transposase [Armatimonadota bacterium]